MITLLEYISLTEQLKTALDDADKHAFKQSINGPGKDIRVKRIFSKTHDEELPADKRLHHENFSKYKYEKKETISLDKLHPIQHDVDREKVKSLIHHIHKGGDHPEIHVVKINNTHHVVDGHHRLVAHALLGNKSIKAKVHDMDKYV